MTVELCMSYMLMLILVTLTMTLTLKMLVMLVLLVCNMIDMTDAITCNLIVKYPSFNVQAPQQLPIVLETHEQSSPTWRQLTRLSFSSFVVFKVIIDEGVSVRLSFPRKRFLGNYSSHHHHTLQGDCLRHVNASRLITTDHDFQSWSDRS